MEGEESRLQKYYDIFKRYITDETVVVALNAEGIISNDESDRLKSMYRKGENQRATAEMLDLILKSQDVRKMGSLKTALRENGHEYLEDLLKGTTDPQVNPREVTMLRHFQNHLAQKLRVIDILPLVFGKGLIEEIDRDEIFKKLEQEGNIRSAMLLIDKIQKRKAPKEWYYGFLESLVESKQEYLAYLLEPDFETNPSSFSPFTEEGLAAGDGKVWEDSVKEFVLTDSCEAAIPRNNLSDRPPSGFSFDEDGETSEKKIVNVQTTEERNSDIRNNLNMDSMNIKVPMDKLSLEEKTDAKGRLTKTDMPVIVINLNGENTDFNCSRRESTYELQGYVHNVLPKRIGREKKNEFFKMTIQTGLETYEDVIVYGHELWQEFKNLEKEGSSISLIGLLKRDNIHKEGTYEYQFVDDSRISPHQNENNFSRLPPPISPPCVIEKIIKEAKIKTLVNVKGKVTFKDLVRQRRDSLNDLLDYCDISIEDSTAKISMTLYDEKCSMVQVGRRYIFNKVRVKYWDKKKLASIIDTTIHECTNEEE